MTKASYLGQILLIALGELGKGTCASKTSNVTIVVWLDFLYFFGASLSFTSKQISADTEIEKPENCFICQVILTVATHAHRDTQTHSYLNVNHVILAFGENLSPATLSLTGSRFLQIYFKKQSGGSRASCCSLGLFVCTRVHVCVFGG